jgi:hypothetical protein
VQAYIAAMPGWKRDGGRRLDALIVRTVPGVYKAVKWNSPFYGIEGAGWFLSYHCFTKYVKVTFFRGKALRPLPPGESKHQDVRYLDIREDQLDEAQWVDWVKQAFYPANTCERDGRSARNSHPNQGAITAPERRAACYPRGRLVTRSTCSLSRWRHAFGAAYTLRTID